MFELLLYGIVFFLVTLLIQYLLSKRKKGKKISFWTGTNTVIIICVLALFSKELNYFAAIIGYIAADSIGEALGWR